MLANIIRKSIVKALRDLKLPAVKFAVEHPENMVFGDFSTNVGIITHKPSEIIDRLKTDKRLSKIASGIKVAGAGFINISIKSSAIITQTNKVIKGKFKTKWSGKKIIIEFTDPNPFKEFHIGHLFSNSVGESLARLLAAGGAEVKRVNYQGDVGMHVAKAVWGMLKNNWRRVVKKPLVVRIKFMGQCYAQGAAAYEEDKTVKKEMEVLNRKIYSLDSEVKLVYQTGRQWSLNYFETIYRRLGTKFDYYFFERQVGETGLKLVKKYLKKGLFIKSQGAIIFPGSQFGLHDRVFINKLGLPTYEAKDLGLALAKHKKYAYDQSLIVTGNEINEYFKVVLAALFRINPVLLEKTKHLGHGMVRLPEGKMSSRTGKVLTGQWLLDEVKTRIKKTYHSSEAVAEAVAVAAVKYALLKSGIGQDVVFDFNKSISLEGNSGPYLQYTYARCRSVLEKNGRVGPFHLGELNAEEDVLLRTLYRFEEVVAQAADELAPNLIANFIYDLAQKFNGFYNQHRIAGNGFRLWLTGATAAIIQRGLNLLGISAPEKM